MVIKNFLFHRVTEEYDELWPALTPSKFEKILSNLEKNYSIVSLEDHLAKSGSINPTKKLVTLSFDDGFKDNFDIAADILYKRGIPASFYVVTDCISNNIPTWTYRLDYLMENTNILDFTIIGLQYRKYYEKLNFNDKQERLNFVRWLKPYLKLQILTNRETILEQIYAQTKDVELPSIMMSWDEVRALHLKGFTIGSHSVTHPMLGQIEQEDILLKELRDSGLTIEKQIGCFPKTISYPNGNYNPHVMNMAKQVGYKYGLAVNQKFYDTKIHDLFEIPRIELYNEPWLKILLRISGDLERIKKLLRK